MAQNEFPYPLGRVVQHDPRSRAFALPESDLSKLSSVRWVRHAPVFDQGNLGSCTGNACLGALATGPLHDALASNNKLPPFTQEQAVEIYSLASAIDEWPGQYPPEDTGSSGLAVAKVAKNKGWLSAYYHAFSFNAALTALQAAPVITGVSWYNSFFYPTAAGECAIKSGATVAGGHEIVIDEMDIERQRVWFTNSWGSRWGLNGRAWFTFDTWEKLLADYGDVTQLIAIEMIDPVNPNPNPDADGCLARMIGPWATKVIGQKWQSKKNKTIAEMALWWIKEKGLSF